jgi:hypothetical protein
MPLTPETQAVFARICTYKWTLLVFGMTQGQAWRLVTRALRAPARPAYCLLNADYCPPGSPGFP